MFIKNARRQQKDHLGVHAVLVAASLFLVSPSLSAMDVAVDCTQPNAIAEALGTLDVIGPHRIFISGVCSESVFISERDRVTIEGVTVDASINDVNIDSARLIVLSNLLIANGLGLPVDIGVSVRSSQVQLQNCTIQNNTRDGVRISDNSHVIIEGTTIQGNGANGLVIESDSSVGVTVSLALNQTATAHATILVTQLLHRYRKH